MPTSTILKSLARKAGVAAAATALGVGAAVAGTTPAHASAHGCTSLPGPVVHQVPAGAVCIDVYGSGTYLDHVVASAIRNPYLVNTQLRITGFDSSGRMRGQFLGPTHYGVFFGWQEYTYNFKANFPELRGGRICASVVESGVARPGACESIY